MPQSEIDVNFLFVHIYTSEAPNPEPVATQRLVLVAELDARVIRPLFDYMFMLSVAEYL